MSSNFTRILALLLLQATGILAQSPESIDSLNAQGFAYLHKGRSDLALPIFEKALKQCGDMYGQQPHSQTAKSLSNVALVHWEQGNLNQAIDFQYQALSIREALYGEEHLEVAASYNDMGLLYAESNPDMALDFYQKALKLYEKSDQKSKAGQAYINIGNAHFLKKEYDKAIEAFEKALPLLNAPNSSSEAFAFCSLGQANMLAGKPDQAHSFYQKSLDIFKKHYGEKHPQLAQLHNLMGALYSSYQEKKDYAKALEHYQEALKANVADFSSDDWTQNPSGEQYGNPMSLLNTLILKSEALEAYHYHKTLKFKHLQIALQTVDVCDRLLQRIRQQRNSKADQIALGHHAIDLYEHGIKLCLAMALVSPKSRYYKEKAFEFSEKSKAATLLASISDTKAKQFANIPIQLLEEERALQANITTLEQQVASGEEPKAGANLQQQLFDARQQHRAFTQRLEKDYPAYYNLKYNVSVASVPDIQAKLQYGQALISYFIAEKQRRMYIFKIGKTSFQTWDLPLGDNFESWLMGFENGIAFQIADAVHEAGLMLNHLLFPKGVLKGSTELILIPDGRLGQLPFEALPSQKGYLIESHYISYAYSATLFMQGKNAPDDTQERMMLLLAPVDFTGAGVRAFMASLPGSEQESREIAALCQQQGIKADIFTKEQAQEQLLKAESLGKYSYLHFATHGIVNEDAPELSQIFLQPGGEDDGDLFSGEIYMLRLHADLVTLSACETGLGKITKGEGMIGLSRALIYAGAKNIMVSLWSVSDASTSILMQEFYRQALGEGLSYRQALAAAKKTLIKHPDYSAPHYWAPFILIGQ